MKISDSQRKFCQLTVDGVSHTEAYLQAYDGCKSRKGASVSAPRVLGYASVQQEIERLRKDMENKKGLTRLKKRQILEDIATDTSLTANSRIQAIATDNRMMGHDEPDKTELKIDPWADLLSRIRDGEKFDSEESEGEVRQHCSVDPI